MCGIAGILRLHDPKEGPPPAHLEAIPERWLDILDESIRHRGPDGAGRFRDRAVRADGTVVDVALVHRRLAIIDIPGGHQPMVHDGERLRPDLTYAPGEAPIVASERAPGLPLVAVVFNGCIYNHRELRGELEGKGYRFGSDHSDTEVLVHGWGEWGLAVQDELDGMYALLIWDRRTGQFAWGRDLAGEKSLYHGFIAEWIRAFSSTQAGIYTLLATERADHLAYADADIIYGCRTYGRVVESAEESMIQSSAARELDARFSPLPMRCGPACSVEAMGALIRHAVTSRLEADVPLGLFLSGGLDSALIATFAQKARPDIKAFTVRMPHPDYDESVAAAETANALGIDHTVLDCDPNPADDLVLLIEQLGLPFGDSSLLPTYWVCKAAREHVKVALSGDGGDELFGGYRRHTINATLNCRRHLLRFIPDRLLDQRNPKGSSSYLARLATAARHSGYPELLAIFSTPDLRRLIPTIDGEPTGDDIFRAIEDPLRHDFEHYLPDDLLRKTDTASMAVALEVRAPFLARELVDAALRTPLDILMPRGQRKGLLKQVARKYLPPEIVDRPKRGFAIPIGEWFRTDYGSMRQLLYDHLESAEPFPGLAEAGVNINMDFVRRMLREHDAAGEKRLNPWHGRDHSQRLYMLLVLSIWAKWLQGVRRGASSAGG